MIKDIYAKKRPLFSFEVFPPKKDGEFEAVYSVLDRLAALNPDFISVTYGAGGSNSKKNGKLPPIFRETAILKRLHI